MGRVMYACACWCIEPVWPRIQGDVREFQGLMEETWRRGGHQGSSESRRMGGKVLEGLLQGQSLRRWVSLTSPRAPTSQ